MSEFNYLSFELNQNEKKQIKKIETEIVLVGDKVISGCIACESCKKNGKLLALH